MQVAPRLLLTETLRERSATRSRVAEEAISISNFVKWYKLLGNSFVAIIFKFGMTSSDFCSKTTSNAQAVSVWAFE
ncbi:MULTISPECIES: hypothetical protein [Nostocaceae]|uniref:hypothetical protein n=1 Tax=Nostocaceae TaxID=1162 RepID=UPI001683D326|nr:MULTISPECIES: hypothetical protein [Nostocaceae]MBD2473927.1 hypothetical protein [Anabaena sp. FACHB-83]